MEYSPNTVLHFCPVITMHAALPVSLKMGGVFNFEMMDDEVESVSIVFHQYIF